MTWVILAWAVAVFAPAMGWAQGTSGTLPDPITTSELNGYADRMRLSEQQRQAAHMLHDQYKQEFKALRQGEIADFLKEMRSMQGTMVMPSRDAMESIMKKMERLNGRIATLDNRLFDQIQPILTEEQMALMPRARMARQRVRFASNQMLGVTGSPGSAGVDLSEMLREVPLTAEELQIIEPMLSTYETRLTASLGKLYDAANSMMLDMFDAMEAKGMTDQDFSDPETAQKFGEAMQQIWQDIMAKAQTAAAALGELNQRTYRSIAPLIAPDSSRALRKRYYGKAYPEASFALGDDEAYLTSLLRSSELSEDQRQAITAARDQMRTKIDAIAEETVALIEEHRKTFSPFDFNSESVQQHYQKINDLRMKVTEARQSAMQAANDALGEEMARKLGQMAMKDAAQSQGMPAAKLLAEHGNEFAADASSDDEDETPRQTWSGDYFVAAPISRVELNEYAHMLKVNDEQKAVLSQLHSAYLEGYKEVEKGPIAALTSAMQARWNFDAKSQTMNTPSTDSIDRVFKLRGEAIAAMKNLDREFFEDVQVAALNPDQYALLDRVRLWRERATCNRSQDNGWAWFGGTNEASIDLSDLVRQQRLNDADRALIDADLLEYERAAVAVFRGRFDAGQRLSKAQEIWQAEMMRAQADGDNNPMKFAAQYQEVMGAASKSNGEANQAVVKLNRESLDKLVAKLPGLAGSSLRLAYNRRAFPSIYNDALALEPKLTAILNLGDLGAEQRRRVEEIAAEYRPAYDNWCHQMVDAATGVQAPTYTGPQDAEAWQKWQERQESIANLRFERSELSLRTINRLKGILSAEQIQHIGGFPEPSEKTPYSEWTE